MRTIKFRFWSNHLGKFVTPDDNIFVGALKDPAMNPMQFTGLKDKNGVEIYEGDVFGNKALRCVIEREDSGAYVARFLNGKIKPISILDHKITNSEVIGNVMENPELLA